EPLVAVPPLPGPVAGAPVSTVAFPTAHGVGGVLVVVVALLVLSFGLELVHPASVAAPRARAASRTMRVALIDGPSGRRAKPPVDDTFMARPAASVRQAA